MGLSKGSPKTVKNHFSKPYNVCLNVSAEVIPMKRKTHHKANLKALQACRAIPAEREKFYGLIVCDVLDDDQQKQSRKRLQSMQ